MNVLFLLVGKTDVDYLIDGIAVLEKKIETLYQFSTDSDTCIEKYQEFFG